MIENLSHFGHGTDTANRHVRYLPLLLMLICLFAQAETVYQGKVVKIADGDTLTLLVDRWAHCSALLI